MDVVQFSYYIDILLGYPEIVISRAFFLNFWVSILFKTRVIIIMIHRIRLLLLVTFIDAASQSVTE
jgi:hypothetical protein